MVSNHLSVVFNISSPFAYVHNILSLAMHQGPTAIYLHAVFIKAIVHVKMEHHQLQKVSEEAKRGHLHFLDSPSKSLKG